LFLYFSPACCNRVKGPYDLVIEASDPTHENTRNTECKGGEKMKRLLMATVTMACISGTAFAMPGHGMPCMGGPGAHFGEGLLKALIRLDLTDAQKHEAALILGKHRDEGKGKREALRSAMEGLRTATETGTFDDDAVRAAFKGVATAGEEMAVHVAKLVAELKGILTPEQNAALEEFKASRHERRKGWRENRTSFLDEWIETHSKEPQ
jgi:Spy/CpxP family protein refolding chaperone